MARYRLVELGTDHINSLGETRDEIENLRQTFYDEDDVFLALGNLNKTPDSPRLRVKSSHKLSKQEFL